MYDFKVVESEILGFYKIRDEGFKFRNFNHNI